MNKMDPKNSKKPADILNGGNSTYLEYLQNMYLKDPKSVDQSWSSFFESSDAIAEKASWSRSDWPIGQKQDFGIHDNSFWGSQSTEALEEKILAYSEKSDFFASTDNLKEKVLDSLRALMIIRAFRIRGHLKAKLDPLEINSLSYHPELDPKNYGFSDLDFRGFFVLVHCRGRSLMLFVSFPGELASNNHISCPIPPSRRTWRIRDETRTPRNSACNGGFIQSP